MGTLLSKQEVIAKLCELTTEVRDHLAKRDGDYLASDCFCGMNPMPDEHFRVDSEVIEWIVDTVQSQLQWIKMVGEE